MYKWFCRGVFERVFGDWLYKGVNVLGSVIIDGFYWGFVLYWEDFVVVVLNGYEFFIYLIGRWLDILKLDFIE